MENIITKQTINGINYQSFEKPSEITASDIGKTIMIAGQKELFILYKIHPEGSPGFKLGGVECVMGISGISKRCFFLDQVKLYDGRDMSKPKGIKKNKVSK
jgi:hypothetical protein